MASARVPLVEPGTDPTLASIERKIVEVRGRVSPLYQALLNSVPVAEGWETLLTAVRSRTSLRPDLRELVILRIAVLNRAPFEFDAHLPHARDAGVAQAKIDGVKTTLASPPYDDLERLILAYTDAMTRDIDVSDSLFERLSDCLDAKTIVELTATIAAYNMVSRFLVALRIGMERTQHGR
ncbi:MAG TPA: carboxymuconolactone decarboxylase family protein [Casimicrobiaceae bacterium]|jgi:alkylhydroperoxidase family enzyme